MTLAQLLVVQAHDTTIDRLVHARANLPEFTVLATLDDEQAHLEAERGKISEQRHAIEREQKRHEDEAALITERIDKDNERLYSGSITAHKELTAIQDELATLGRRRSEIEDQVLETMEAAEPLDASLDDFDKKLADVQSRRELATESLLNSQMQIDDEMASEQAERAESSVDIEATLLAEYEASRAACGGVGICRLIDKTCQGCHLTVPSVEYDRIRKAPEGAIVRHVECNRILVT